MILSRCWPCQLSRFSILFPLDDVEEFLPVLVEVVVGGGAFLHVHDGLFHGSLGEGAAADLDGDAAVDVDVGDVVAALEGIVANLLHRHGEGELGEAGTVLEGTAADLLQRVGEGDRLKAGAVLEHVGGDLGEAVGNLHLLQAGATLEGAGAHR